MAKTKQIISRLHEEYGEPRTELKYSNVWELVVATILSARTTDKQVNKVTKELFKKYKTIEDYAEADNFAEDINSIGLYPQKAERIQKSAKIILEEHSGKIPDKIDELVELPGIGRKTANVVLANAFGKAVGVVVDTHVKRVGERLGLHGGGSPVKIEKELMKEIPEKEWIFISHGLINHGRAICKARKPRCPKCFLKDICPSSEQLTKEHWE